jgi:vacuolar-type H+-ATPase subunit I/STV1
MAGNNHSGLAKSLAFAFFISCAVSAFSVAMLAFTYITGEYPFGIIPTYKLKPHSKKKAERVVESKGPGSNARLDEDFLKSFYEEMEREREKIAEEKKKLDIRQKVVTEIKDEALKMQEEITKKETEVRNLLVLIDKTEIENIKRISSLMSGMEPANAVKMFVEQSEDMAARTLYFMNQKSASDIIGLALNDPKEVDRINRIIKKMQLLTEKMETGE